jgi:large subunit ribosomal protein L21e
MVRKSYGKMRGTRYRLENKGVTNITRYLEEFNVGDTVNITFTSTIVPHPRFHGFTGKVLGKRGRGYIIEVREGGKHKKISIRPEHLKK